MPQWAVSLVALISCLWRGVYANITPRNIYVPTVPYLRYLGTIIRCKQSRIYDDFPPESILTLTYYLDLTESDEDAAMHPYSVFCSMPNYIGFRKGFPNMKYTDLKIRFRITSGLYLYRPTRSNSGFIGLNTTALSILPVDWCIAVSHAPDVNEADFNHTSYARKYSLWISRMTWSNGPPGNPGVFDTLIVL
ncbi:hypothetical protein F5146DRAFT_1139226 [Armillaria mellea]|nr:hypothetical protein F5146DRAFT_1139226 [Armillaria mellea]